MSASWVCPACGRRVPKTVGECRCGHLAARPSTSADEANADATGRSNAFQTATSLFVAVVAIVGTVWWMNSRRIPTGMPPDAPTYAQPAAGTPLEPSQDGPEDTGPLAPIADASPLDAAAPTIEELVSRVAPAVVTVQTPTSRGSGFFVAADTVITNVHVVGSNATVAIGHPGGGQTSARVEIVSPTFDIAVLRVRDAVATQPTVPLGSTANVRIGAEVIAIGTPLGFLQNSVSRGIVSGLRNVGAATLVQTDAAINPGNSGGPLLDRDGVVIGVIKSGYLGRDGLAFAVAVDHVRAVLNGQRDSGTIVPPEGARYDSLPPAIDIPASQSRLDATRAFEETISRLARRADVLDRNWQTFTARCYRGQIVGTFDRPWFALWDARAMQGTVAPGCVPYFNEFRSQADDVRQSVEATDETARRGEVYPGTRRDVLRRHKLDHWSR
jgi:S1-C subfamily serine protease